MSLTTLPPFFDMNYTKPDGKLAADGYLYNDQMFQVLNLAISLINTIVVSAISNNIIMNNGLTPPPFTTAQITAFSTDATIPNGTIWFNSDTSEWQGKESSGVIKTFTVT